MVRVLLGVLCAVLATVAPLALSASVTVTSEQTKANAPPAPTRMIVLVRHGHYSPDPSIDEAVGPGLSVLGVAQARLAGARLAALPFQFDTVIASSMARAQDTAAVIAEDLAVTAFATDPDLAECTPPSRRTDITGDTPASQQRDCARRMDRVFDRYFRNPPPADHTTHSAQRTLLVCHGNVIRYLITRALGVDTRAWLEMSLGHASLTTILIEADGRYKLIAAGDVGHLPANLRTGASGDLERDLRVPKARSVTAPEVIAKKESAGKAARR